MDHLQTLLGRFKKFTTPNQKERELVAEFCTNLSKEIVSKSQVRVSGQCIYVDVRPILKGEVVMRKKELLNLLNKDSASKELFTDVR